MKIFKRKKDEDGKLEILKDGDYERLGIPRPPKWDLPGGDLRSFDLTARAREDIERRKEQRRRDHEKLLAELGFIPQREWWEE